MPQIGDVDPKGPDHTETKAQKVGRPRQTSRSDLTGRRFGKLLVQGIAFESVDAALQTWLVSCDCGGFEEVRRPYLLSGQKRRCSKCSKINQDKRVRMAMRASHLFG